MDAPESRGYETAVRPSHGRKRRCRGRCESSAAGAALRVVDTAGQLQTAAFQASSIVGRNPITAVALSSAQTLGNRAGSLQMMASSSGRLLRESTSKLESLANVPAATVQSMRVAAACAERTATLCRQTAGEAAKITGVATA